MSNTTNATQARSGYTVYVIVRKVLVYLLAAAIVVGGGSEQLCCRMDNDRRHSY